jgi:hypothetical protein
VWLLDNIHFFDQLDIIQDKKKNICNKSGGSALHPYYQVAQTTSNMYDALQTAKEAFLNAQCGPEVANKRQFLTACKTAIDDAALVLNTHRGLKEACAVLCNWIVRVISAFQYNPRAEAARVGVYNFFRPQTDTSRIVAPLRTSAERAEAELPVAASSTGASLA